MNSINSVDALTRAQASFDNYARQIASKGPSPQDFVGLIVSQNQFSADAKVTQTQDQMDQKLLDIFA